MARIDFRDFEENGQEVARVYLAATLDESRRVEEALEAAGLLYAVQVEPFATMNLFGASGRATGAAFYVLEAEAGAAVATLRGSGLSAGIVDEHGG